MDYHIEIEGHYYSAPYSLAHQEVDVRHTARTVEIFHHSRRIASHAKDSRRGCHSTIREHMPRNHQEFLEWTPTRIVERARAIGPRTAELVEYVLNNRDFPQQGYRTCLGIIRLAKEYPQERLEAANDRALKLKACSYRSVHSILEKGLDRQPLMPAALTVAVAHENIRVAGVMRENKIVAVQKRKFRLTTNSKHDYPVWPNILSRNFTVERPNAVWVSDITYVWTHEGWLYVAAVLDLFSRGIVGLAMDRTIADTLTTQAMQQAILRRDPPKGLICHTDRGSQYAGNAFKSILAEREFVGSMSRKGNCWDNAVAESFFHTLKVELVHRHKFRTREEARRKIFEYVEMFYNRKRAHSTLGYLSPFEYEKRLTCLN